MKPRNQDFAFQLGCVLFVVIVLLTTILILYGLFVAAVALLPVVLCLFWIAMLIDCVKNEPNEKNGKIVWTLIIVFLNIPGAFLYFFLERPKIRMHRRDF
jgi:hypothetical protein